MATKTMNFKTAFSEKKRHSLNNFEKSLTKQEFKDECDVNKIVSKYDKTGILTHINNNKPVFMDTTGIDYREALHTVIDANKAFDELPSILRKRFSNDPALMLEFLQDSSNLDEAIKLGLVEPPKEDLTSDKPPKTEPVDAGEKT